MRLGQDPRERARRPCRRAGVWVGVSLACRDLWGLAKGLRLVRSPASAAGVTAPSRRGRGGQRLMAEFCEGSAGTLDPAEPPPTAPAAGTGKLSSTSGQGRQQITAGFR